jgi:hypothetical protein
MNDMELDALLNAPLPERDAGEFSVLLMERITQYEARPARILSWISAGVMLAVIAAACVFGASAVGQVDPHANNMLIPGSLILLSLLLSYVVMQSVRE